MILKMRPVAVGGGDKTRGAFTLIELLTVMAIILILAGLILSIAGNANYKGSLARASGEIQAFSAAIESYKTDNGAYPRITAANGASNSYTTDTLLPNSSFDPAAAQAPTYSGTSETLYQLLSGWFNIDANGKTALATGTPLPTRYYTFKDTQLSPANMYPFKPANVTAIIDPFGLSYGYSTAYQAEMEAIQASQTPGTPVPSPAPTPQDGYNPTYDLWSTAGYSKTSGKAYPANVSAPSLWVKNWQ